MNNNALKELVDRFDQNLSYYKTTQNAYNEHSCRIEYIDPLLEVLGWDVANRKGLAPQSILDILVLGAFGCGAFENDPEVVARAYKTVLQEFPRVFEQIEFAVYCTPKSSVNYDVFKRVLG